MARTHTPQPLPSRLSATALVLALALLPAAPALAQAAAPRAGQNVTLDFDNADIDAVARTMAVMTGRNVVVDPRVKGTMTLTSTSPVSPAQAMRLFATQLRTQGFALVERDGMSLVVPEAEAKLQSGSVQAGRAPAPGGQVLTQIFRLTHEDANDLVPILRPLISPNNTINVNPGANALVITDYGDNLQRLGRIIAALDVANATDMEIVRLQHAVAADLAPLVAQLLDSGATASGGAQRPPPAAGVPGAAQAQAQTVGGGGGYRTTLIPEPRSNAIIVRAANPARLALAKKLIQQLDQPPQTRPDGGSGNIHVVYLKNAEATKLATTLRAALAALPGQSASSGSGAVAGGGGGSSSTASASSSNGSASTSLSTGPSLNHAADNQPSTGGQIQADPATNSLIISAPEPVYRELRAVIDQLDQRRAQVYIESLIAEVNMQRSADFGIQWQGLLGNQGDPNIGYLGTNFGAMTGGNILGLGNAINNLIDGGNRAVNGTPRPGINLALAHNFGAGYLLSALANFIQTTGTGNVLSTPTLLTLDNEEAKIIVGQNLPFVTGSYTNTGASGATLNPFQTYERQDVGLTLRVRPQIGENGTIKLTIYQESSAVQGATTAGPVTRKRAIESNVLVEDGAVIALGGLLEDTYEDSVDKVPGLGDIPMVGNLFKSQNRKQVKTNLMIFLRPVIVRDAADTESFSLSRYDVIRAGQQASQPAHSSVLQVNQAPVLPPVQPSTPNAGWTRPAPPAPLIHSITRSEMPASGEANYINGTTIAPGESYLSPTPDAGD